MKQNKEKVTHQGVNKNLEHFIRKFSKDFGDSNVRMDSIESAARIFVETLTPLERGMLLFEDAEPIQFSQLNTDDRNKYLHNIGAERIKKGCFFRRKSGAVIFISHINKQISTPTTK